MHQGVIGRHFFKKKKKTIADCVTVCLSLSYTHQVSLCPNGNYARLLSCMCVCVCWKERGTLLCFPRDL